MSDLNHVVAERVAGNLHWSVSFDSSTAEPGIVRLRVTLFGPGPGCRIIGPGDHDGRPFPDTDAAVRFALDHGYLRRYFTTPELRARRILRAWKREGILS